MKGNTHPCSVHVACPLLGKCSLFISVLTSARAGKQMGLREMCHKRDCHFNNNTPSLFLELEEHFLWQTSLCGCLCAVSHLK